MADRAGIPELGPKFATIAGVAAVMDALVSATMFVVAILCIGVAAMSDPAVMMEAARANSLAFFVQDTLKVLSVTASMILIVALTRILGPKIPALIAIAVGAAILSELALLTNAGLSLAALMGSRLVGAASYTGLTALAALVLGGLWLILINWAALKQRRLPATLCWIGMLAGLASLVPPLAILSLLFGVAWTLGIARVLWSHPAP